MRKYILKPINTWLKKKKKIQFHRSLKTSVIQRLLPNTLLPHVNRMEPRFPKPRVLFIFTGGEKEQLLAVRASGAEAANTCLLLVKCV